MQATLPYSTSAALRLGILIFLGLVLFAPMSCTPNLPGTDRCRSVRIKVVVNSDIAANSRWNGSVTPLFEKADLIMRRWARVTLVVDTMAVWDIEKSPSFAELLPGDCLIKEQPKNGRDIVVYLGRPGNASSLIASMTLYEIGYAYVPLDAGSIDSVETCLTLVHWLAHMFGAVHCYFENDNMTAMNPFIHDGILTEPARNSAHNPPKFHEGNGEIMRVLSVRSFEDRVWDSAAWGPIRQVYSLVRKKYNPWKINGQGELFNHESDAFHEGNLLLYCSSWASLCGRERQSLAYLDTLERLYGAIQKTCITRGIVGKTKLCSVCGFDSSSVNNWFEVQMFYLGIRRTMVLLRCKNIPSADTSFAAVVRDIPPDLSALKEKFVNRYRLYKVRFGGSGEEPSRPDLF
jgi:hypothetical protein